MQRTGDRCSKTENQSLCFLLSLGRQHSQANHPKWEPSFSSCCCWWRCLEIRFTCWWVAGGCSAHHSEAIQVSPVRIYRERRTLHGAPSSCGLLDQAQMTNLTPCSSKLIPVLIFVISPDRLKQQALIYRDRCCFGAAGGTFRNATQSSAWLPEIYCTANRTKTTMSSYNANERL